MIVLDAILMPCKLATQQPFICVVHEQPITACNAALLAEVERLRRIAPIKCDVCGYRFETEGRLYMHSCGGVWSDAEGTTVPRESIDVIDVPHPDVDVKVAFTEDFTPEDVMQVMRQLQSPTAVTEAIPIPDSVKTMGDFFEKDGAMARQIANQVADKIFPSCARCGAESVKLVPIGTRKLCAECAPLEF